MKWHKLILSVFIFLGCGSDTPTNSNGEWEIEISHNGRLGTVNGIPAVVNARTEAQSGGVATPTIVATTTIPYQEKRTIVLAPGSYTLSFSASAGLFTVFGELELSLSSRGGKMSCAIEGDNTSGATFTCR